MTLLEARNLTLKILKQVMEEKLDHHNVQLAQVCLHGWSDRPSLTLWLCRLPRTRALRLSLIRSCKRLLRRWHGKLHKLHFVLTLGQIKVFKFTVAVYGASTMHSTSTNTSLGRRATSTADLAGLCEPKKPAYTSFISAKSFMLWRKTCDRGFE